MPAGFCLSSFCKVAGGIVIFLEASAPYTSALGERLKLVWKDG